MTALTPFERAVLDALLAGEDPRLALLRMQAGACAVIARRHTGVGCLVDLAVPADLPRSVPPAMTLADVDIQLADASAATVMAFVRKGALVLLEFVSEQGDWPADPAAQRIGYFRYEPTPSKGYVVLPSASRDPATLALQLAGHASTSR